MNKYWFPYQETMMRSASLTFFYMSLDQNLEKLHHDESWYDPKLDRKDNKDRMKHFGGSLFSYQIHMYENLFLGAQKIFEDFQFNFRRAGGAQIKIWDSRYDAESDILVLRTINALVNIIKHNGSFVEEGRREKHAKHLIDNGFSHNEDYLKYSGSWEKLRSHYGFPEIVYLTKVAIEKLMYLNLEPEHVEFWKNRNIANYGYAEFLDYAIPANLHDEYKDYWPSKN